MSSDFPRLRAQLLDCLPPFSAEAADAALASQLPDGSWGDIDYQDRTPANWRPQRHLDRTLPLAQSWLATRDARHRDAAIAGLASWIARDPICTNWWHNQIGRPRVLGETLLCLLPDLPPALLAAARSLLARAAAHGTWTPAGVRPKPWTGANRLWISANRLLAGALYEDEALVLESLASALAEVRVSSAHEEGIQADGSFHQHGPLLYNGGYGAAYLKECVFFLSATHGTRWQPDLKYHRILADYLLDGTRWMLRGGELDFGCRDREMTRPAALYRPPAAPARFLASVGLPRSAELAELADALDLGDAPGSLAGLRMFPRSDFMVWQSPAARVSVRMHSTRTVRAECCNAEGRRSHHVADGLSCLQRTGEEYRDIFPVWDWARLPGTTCLQPTRPEPWQTVLARGRSASVGGVSDGRHGACTQQLHTDALLARKSWFFGPDAIVCLGAGIASAHAGRVVTTLDQSLVQGSVEWSEGGVAVTAFAAESASPARVVPRRLGGLRWLRHASWGFVFPQAADISLELGPRTGAWSDIGDGPSEPVTKDVFLAALDHGEAPEAAAYAYAIVPDATTERLASLAAAPTWQILQNTPRLQAVWRESAALLQAVFLDGGGDLAWGDGWRLRVNRECAVQLSRDSVGAWRLDLADIRQEGHAVAVSLLDPSGAVLLDRPVEVPVGDRLGFSVRAL